ncbi:MAG: ABC transporter permease, partial [Clostridiales bacterium]|nr:ABC transporter permease [Clostridiales bacterium]
AISISERSRHLGMLASVGATRGQKRRSVFFEGFVIGIISIPLGIGFGILGMWVTFQCISPLIANILANAAALRLIVSPFSVVVSAVFSALTIFISSWIPARRASRITPIDAIRQSKDVKLKGRAVKTSRLTRKVFGFEAELALKNLKRNKKRYRSTIFSLIISIVLFLATSFYLNFSQAALGMDMEASDYDLAVTSYSEQEGDAVSFYQQVRGLPLADEVTAVNQERASDLSARIPEKLIPKELNYTLKTYSNMTQGVSSDGEAYYDVEMQLMSLDDEALKKYAAQCGVDYNTLKDADHPSAILYNRGVVRDKEGRFVETQMYLGHVWDTLELPLYQKSIQLAGLAEEAPVGVSQHFWGSYVFVVSEDTLAILGRKYSPDNASLLISSSNPNQLEEDINTLYREQREQHPSLSVDVTNVAAARQYNNSSLILVLVFVYGFITLITLICIANIFNTISTSLSLRRREFAMLQSVGMTPKGFNRMIRFESLFYGVKALLYALPISFLILFWMYHTISGGFGFALVIPWGQIGIAVAAVFFVVSITMLYSGHKIKKQNIIDTLKQENI